MNKIMYSDTFFLTDRLIFQISIFAILLFWSIYIIYFEHLVPMEFILTGITTVILFFIVFKWLFKKLLLLKNVEFVKALLLISIVFRVLATITLYYYFLLKTGSPFEYYAVDSKFYHETGIELSNQIVKNNFNFNNILNKLNFSDRGYNLILGYLYSLTGKSILITRIIFSVISALSVFLLYRCTKNIYDELRGRLAAILMLLLPNFSLYLGTHLKETILVFIVLLFLDQSIQFLKSNGRSVKTILIILLCIISLFMFRTVLGVVAIASFLGFLLTINKNKQNIKKIIISLLLLIGVYSGLYFTDIGNEINEYLEKSSTAVSDNLQFRAERDGGNKFAILAGAPLFISLILIVPFPSMVYVKGQDFLWMFMAANFIKNILAYFTIKGIYISVKTNFKKSSIFLYFMLGYLLIIANSGFAISERFHLPILPITLIMVSIGLTKQISIRYSFLFILYILLIGIIILAWNYIKLAGRI